MYFIDDEQVEDFSAKLGVFRESLPDEQKPLLDAILRIVWRATKHEAGDEFDGSFTPGQAELVLAYDQSRTGLAESRVAMIDFKIIKPSTMYPSS